MLVRAGTPADYPAFRLVLEQAPEAAQWLPEGYDFFVAETAGVAAGFVVWRHTAPDEIEILNLAVRAANRRSGMATTLITALPAATIFLEVRESNLTARAFYAKLGFAELCVRPAYYENPREGAIVMRLQS